MHLTNEEMETHLLIRSMTTTKTKSHLTLHTHSRADMERNLTRQMNKWVKTPPTDNCGQQNIEY